MPVTEAHHSPTIGKARSRKTGANQVGSVPSVQGLSVIEIGSEGDIVRQTELVFDAMPFTIVDANVSGSQKVYDFPDCRLLVLGCTGEMVFTTTSDPTTTLNAGVTVAWGLGTTAAAADGTLAGTEQDLLPTTNFTSSTVQNVAPAATTAALAASAQFNGTSTPVDAFLNMAVAVATDIDGNATLACTGRITMTWANLGTF